jgi:glutamine synthetase
MSIDDVIKKVDEHGVKFIRLQFVDILGNPKNIVIPEKKLETAFEDGVLFDGSSIAGYATIEESDYIAIPDPESFVILPPVIVPRPVAKLNCNIFNHEGKRYIGDPKYVLERILNKENSHILMAGPECEFFLFKKEQENPTLIPNDSAGYFDLSHIDLAENVRADISQALQQLGIKIHSSHHEVGRGQHEIDIYHSDALTIADWVITFKYVVKVVASHHNLYASFMPKPIYGTAGNGMHIHLSLENKRGDNIFYDSQSEDGISKMGKNFIAGIIRYIKEMTAILNPTVNSYKRLIPGYEAPTYISWADRNRSALIRIPAERKKGTRCELRSPDSSGNPYLQFAVILAAGLQGIKEKLQPPEKIEEDLYSMDFHKRQKLGIGDLPDNLHHALALMEGSELMRDTLGEHIFHHFLYIKKREWEEYKQQVTKWETDRYLPLL